VVLETPRLSALEPHHLLSHVRGPWTAPVKTAQLAAMGTTCPSSAEGDTERNGVHER
jgi:hypothetical protein